MSSKLFNRARDSSNVNMTDYDRSHFFFTHASMCPCAACRRKTLKGNEEQELGRVAVYRKRCVDDTS